MPFAHRLSCVGTRIANRAFIGVSALRWICPILSDNATIEHVSAMFRESGLAPGLRAYGVKESLLDAMSDQAFADTCHRTNPVPMTRDDLHKLYQLAM